MSRLVGKSAEERNGASVMVDIFAGTKNKTAAEVAVEIVTDAPKLSGQKVLYAVLAADTAGRAKVLVREDSTKSGSWAWVETRMRQVSQKRSNTVGRERSRSKTCGAGTFY